MKEVWQAYLDHAMQFSSKEERTRDELMSWLPDVIIDAHAHANQASQVQVIDPTTMAHMMSTFPAFDLEASERVKAVFFPGKRVKTLRFANAYRGIDHVAANDYLLSQTQTPDRVALYGIPTDEPYTVAGLRDPRVAGLKMYPRFFIPPAGMIYEYFPPLVLEAAQEYGQPIILHLPVMITRCLEDLRRCVEDFPRLVVVLAHFGLPHLPVPGLEEAFATFAAYPNIFVDNAMVPSAVVATMAMRAFGTSRVLYGSDEPLNLLRFTVYEHPEKGQRIVSDYPYHWVDPDEHHRYGHLAKGCIHAHWQSIEALRIAISTVAPNDQAAAARRVFHDNAQHVFRFE